MLLIARFEIQMGVILNSVLHVSEFLIRFLEYCTAKHGSPDFSYAVLYYNECKGAYSNTAPCSSKFGMPHPNPVTQMTARRCENS